MFRAVLTLLLGSGAAQLGPLLLGPFLSRQYGPEAFGLFHLASAIGANVAVVACARYEFALPLARDEAEAQALRRLCVRILRVTTAACLAAALAAAAWWQASWPLAVPALVGTLGALSLWTLEATRAQCFGALSLARVMQLWGGGLIQLGLGVLQSGLWGLLLGPIVAAALATATLWRAVGRRLGAAVAASRGARDAASPAGPSLREVAQRHRDFPLLNMPHAFLGVLQDTLGLALIAASAGPAAAGVWGLSMRYLKAPATLAGGAVSQVLYPRLAGHGGPTPEGIAQVRRVMLCLAAAALALGLLIMAGASWALPALLGEGWEQSGPLSQALALYLALHFVASPLGVVTMAWGAQAWALKVSLIGSLCHVGALCIGLAWPHGADGPLVSAAWAVSMGMGLYFAAYFWRLWNWPPLPAARDNQGFDPSP